MPNALLGEHKCSVVANGTVAPCRPLFEEEEHVVDFLVLVLFSLPG